VREIIVTVATLMLPHYHYALIWLQAASFHMETDTVNCI